MIYAMSDIHGCIEALKYKMEQIDLRGDDPCTWAGSSCRLATMRKTISIIR